MTKPIAEMTDLEVLIEKLQMELVYANSVIEGFWNMGFWARVRFVFNRYSGNYPKGGKEMKYVVVKDGEWIQPVRRGYKMVCCDCGLVHILDFRIKKRHIQFRARRDNRATSQIRRHAHIPKRLKFYE